MRPPPKLSELPDQEVVELALEGRQAAYTELRRRYVHRVYEIALDVVKYHERAEDVVQKTFTKAFKSLHRYDPKYKFATWILTIGGRTAIDAKRTREFDAADGKRAVPPEYLDQHGIGVEPASDDSTPPDPKPVNPAHAALRRAMRKLHPLKRQCLELKYRHKLKYPEIAEELGLPTGTVKSYISRGLDTLKKELDADPHFSR